MCTVTVQSNVYLKHVQSEPEHAMEANSTEAVRTFAASVLPWIAEYYIVVNQWHDIAIDDRRLHRRVVHGDAQRVECRLETLDEFAIGVIVLARRFIITR